MRLTTLPTTLLLSLLKPTHSLIVRHYYTRDCTGPFTDFTVDTLVTCTDLLKSIGERLTPPSSPPGTPGSGGSQRPVLTLHPIALHHSHRIAHLLRQTA
ncbi:hypothetical protein HK097_005624 [Rhizophlyctis rosea]|uniref:Secreted protein n=1 Tax=Rhizophlyctis rosea TaxID=64517 RepID=A0AAD5X5G8_9FUNG|nr:hypothetical protein HK097_005624 [Rhizophlyctis rosea]